MLLASRRPYEARRIAKQMSDLYGRLINRKHVRRLMNEHGLVAKGRKKTVVTTDSLNLGSPQQLSKKVVFLKNFDTFTSIFRGRRAKSPQECRYLRGISSFLILFDLRT